MLNDQNHSVKVHINCLAAYAPLIFFSSQVLRAIDADFSRDRRAFAARSARVPIRWKTCVGCAENLPGMRSLNRCIRAFFSSVAQFGRGIFAESARVRSKFRT